MAIAITRTDLSARELRVAAAKVKDCKAARRMLAIALVLDGVDRKAGYGHQPDGRGGLLMFLNGGGQVPFNVAVRQNVITFSK